MSPAAESRPEPQAVSPEVTERADSAQKPKTTLPRIAAAVSSCLPVPCCIGRMNSRLSMPTN